jgi:hypothetical protein
LGQRGEHGDRSPAIRDLDGFTGLDAAQQFTGTLTELTNTYRCHVLFVAQEKLERETGSSASSTKQAVEFSYRLG